MDSALRLILLGAVILVAAIDLLLLAVLGKQHTISAVGYRAMKDYPIIGVLLGILIGHLAWPNC